MELNLLERHSDYEWEIPQHGAMRMPAVIYASEALIRDMDHKVYEQAVNVAALPGIVRASYAMPDAHWGYGFPIGGVAAFDPDQGGVISAGGVGFDIFRALSADIARDQGLMLLSGGMVAQQRLVAFLLSLSNHYARIGYSPDCFVLRMTRAAIGSYLGLSLETVSRVISGLHRERLIAVRQREVRLVDIGQLREIAAG